MEAMANKGLVSSVHINKCRFPAWRRWFVAWWQQHTWYTSLHICPKLWYINVPKTPRPWKNLLTYHEASITHPLLQTIYSYFAPIHNSIFCFYESFFGFTSNYRKAIKGVIFNRKHILNNPFHAHDPSRHFQTKEGINGKQTE